MSLTPAEIGGPEDQQLVAIYDLQLPGVSSRPAE
jgi:hypothetical protein